jgi:hypothetical protein
MPSWRRPDIDVLWDTWVISHNEKYKLRFVRSEGKWLAQRTDALTPSTTFVSTREPVDSREWTTWYIAEGDWHGTAYPPLNGRDNARWKPVGPAPKFLKKGEPLVVFDAGEDEQTMAPARPNPLFKGKAPNPKRKH